jgi:hypothetical protein
MGFGRAAEAAEVSFPQKLSCSAVLADPRPLVGYGVPAYIGHTPLAQTVVADLHESVAQLVGVKKLDELLLKKGIAPGKVDRTRLSQHPKRIFRRQILLCLLLFFHQELEDPRSLGHILEPQVPLEECLAAALR